MKILTKNDIEKKFEYQKMTEIDSICSENNCSNLSEIGNTLCKFHCRLKDHDHCRMFECDAPFNWKYVL